MKTLTVKELKLALDSYPDDMPVVITEDGPSHDWPISLELFEIIKNPYFPDSDVEEILEDEPVLRIALI